MNRYNFLKYSTLVSSSFLIPSLIHAKEKENIKKITILHTNDQHSRIEPFEEDSGKYSNRGGFARRATLIEKVRSEEKNVVLLDAGDTFQGTPYFNYFGGELEFKLMSKMKYDASIMGNHDFDNGLQGFKKQLPHANFDFICSNYNFDNTILEGITKKYQIINKEGIKIGVFGLGIELEGLVSKNNYNETIYIDPIEITQEITNKLINKEKCNLVICLSHLGYEYKNEKNKISDIKLAQQTTGIDLIIGGHTHTFLNTPTIMSNKEGKNVVINQVGWAGLLLGKIDFYFSSNKVKQNTAFSQLPIDNFYT